MANITFKSSRAQDLIKLSSPELKILIALSTLVKYNHIYMDNDNYNKITQMTGLQKKTIQNNLTKLVANEIAIKAGTLPNYVVDPTVFTTGNAIKCFELYNLAVQSESAFQSRLHQHTSRARGDFETRIFEAGIEARRLSGGISSNIEEDL